MPLMTNLWQNEKIRWYAYAFTKDEEEAKDKSIGMWGEWGKHEDGFVYTTDDGKGIISIALCIGMGALTKRNLKEWVRRIRLHEILSGRFLCKRDKKKKKLIDVDVDLRMLNRFIGFSSNMNIETATRFNNRMVKEHAKKAERELEKLTEEKESADA